MFLTDRKRLENIGSKIELKALPPEKDVSLDDGLFKEAFASNIRYLLSSFTAEDLLNDFRKRAGKPVPERQKPYHDFWEGELEGSNAGRFLMGAGTSLRWTDNPELKKSVETVVNGIFECVESDGYCMAYNKSHTTIGERMNYTRQWLTRGLLAAGYSVCPDALSILRENYNWFNKSKYLEKTQSMRLCYTSILSNTSLYLSSVGKEEDLQKALEYFVEDWWLSELAARKESAIWKYKPNNYHGYEINGFTGYLELYMLTGEKRFLDAVLGAWELINSRWEHDGGSIAICEEFNTFSYPPGSRFINKEWHTGELCSTVFWIDLNQRLHMLFPKDEKYVAEIEKSLYNVVIPSIGKEGEGFRYHTFLHGISDKFQTVNSCCEGMGTMLLGSLPEYIYSLESNGVYVNLFTNSSIKCEVPLKASIIMKTEFPFADDVSLFVEVQETFSFSIFIRIPQWISDVVEVIVNNEVSFNGIPGSYLEIKREWNSGDKVTFKLPKSIIASRYTGLNSIKGFERFSVSYGPLLMAFCGNFTEFPKEESAYCDRTHEAGAIAQSGTVVNFNRKIAVLDGDVRELKDNLVEDPEKELSFYVKGRNDLVCTPYFMAGNDAFSCYPAFKPSKVSISSNDYVKPDDRFAYNCYKNAVNLDIKLNDDIFMEFVPIPRGQFIQGEEEYERDESPRHTVIFSKPFFMGKYPVLQKQWECVMGSNPSTYKYHSKPVEGVSWYDCMEYIDMLNVLYKQSGLTFSIPTEAEWEYASRGSISETPFYFGDPKGKLSAQYLSGDSISTGINHPSPASCGLKLQNTWGLYDMLGGVGQWCMDWYKRDYYITSAQEDPKGPKNGLLKVFRGGSRCGERLAAEPELGSKYVGLRLVCRV